MKHLKNLVHWIPEYFYFPVGISSPTKMVMGDYWFFSASTAISNCLKIIYFWASTCWNLTSKLRTGLKINSPTILQPPRFYVMYGVQNCEINTQTNTQTYLSVTFPFIGLCFIGLAWLESSKTRTITKRQRTNQLGPEQQLPTIFMKFWINSQKRRDSRKTVMLFRIELISPPIKSGNLLYSAGVKCNCIHELHFITPTHSGGLPIIN